jgi:rhodanese-related sulfurtransferase
MKNMFKTILMLAMTIAISCTAQTSEKVTVIDQHLYNELTQDMEIVQLVDVRTPDEYAEGYINDAENINFFDADFVSQCEKYDKNLPIFIYCQSGGRSAKASAKLEAAGFTKVYDVGGYRDWKK